jgi:hypothetical protein
MDFQVATHRQLQGVGSSDMSNVRVKTAFQQVRDGRSPEYVICDATLNESFLAAARRLGVQSSDAKINTTLINLRKQSKLKDCPTKHRKKPDPNRRRYLNAVLNAIRLVERQFGKNVDDVICDPDTLAQFDAMIQFLSPGTSAFESQYAALSLRKSNQLKPEPVGQVIRAVGSKMLSLSDLEDRIAEMPEKTGVYIFFDSDTTLYAGKADNLRKRIATHISTWSFCELIRQMRKGQRPQAFVVFHELPVTISARELAAYETELIRSRDPEHNRMGKTTDAEATR